MQEFTHEHLTEGVISYLEIVVNLVVDGNPYTTTLAAIKGVDV